MIKIFNFRPVKEEGLWSSEGCGYYNGELIRQPRSSRTYEERLRLLEYHPFFTGECPNCGYQFDRSNPPDVYWDCPVCKWVDDYRDR